MRRQISILYLEWDDLGLFTLVIADFYISLPLSIIIQLLPTTTYKGTAHTHINNFSYNQLILTSSSHTATMEEAFFYALLRISIAQILKASGFDKCKPSTLNAVTDIYIKHFELVLNSAKKYGQARTRCTNVLEAPDLVQALLDVQLIKPSTGDSILDPRDAAQDPQTEYNVKSLESFVRWLQFSDSFSLAKRLSEVPSSQLRNLMEKRKIDTSSETDQEKKKRRLRERQEYYNQLKSGEDPANAQYGGMPEDLEEAEVTENDKLSWLEYLAEKDVKLGHNLQYMNTVLHDTVLPIHKNSKFHPSKDGEDAYKKFISHAQNSTRNDHVVVGIHDADNDNGTDGAAVIQPSEKLKESLPYNIKYQDSLLNDDLQQYIDYAEKYGFPATPVSANSPSSMDVDQSEEKNGVTNTEDGDQSDKSLQSTDPTSTIHEHEKTHEDAREDEEPEMESQPAESTGEGNDVSKSKTTDKSKVEDEAQVDPQGSSEAIKVTKEHTNEENTTEAEAKTDVAEEIVNQDLSEKHEIGDVNRGNNNNAELKSADQQS
ncbi:hypothetical protein ACI3LY_005214 [Candidozyma auris]|nr:hypothetical protein QG37_06696 [[Candida] auris]